MDSAPQPDRPYSGSGPAGDAAPRTDGAKAESSPPTAGVVKELSIAFAAARAVLSNLLDLVSLEGRRAGLALIWMVVCGLVSAICISAAWLGLMTAITLGLLSLGLPLIAAVIGVSLVNVAAGAVLIRVCITMSSALLFSATRRQVAGHSPAQPSAS